MIDDEELKLRIVKFEQLNSEIKTDVQAKPGKLGPWQVHNGIIDSHKIAGISQQFLKNQSHQ